MARRQNTKADSFFARILGFAGFDVSAEAIGYIGFAGSLNPYDVDAPIAICKQALLIDGKYQCSVGRMINSGQGVVTVNSGGWTDYNQVVPCQGGTNANALTNLLKKCPSTSSGNPVKLILGGDMALTNGMDASVFKKYLYDDCWINNSANRTKIWNLTLPVIDCPSNVVGPTCSKLMGAVTIGIVWINEQNDPQYKDAPYKMGNWESSDPDGKVRWASFVNYYNLKNLDGSPASYMDKTIYFLPDCTPHEPTGTSGGQNFGILAKTPVLVK